MTNFGAVSKGFCCLKPADVLICITTVHQDPYALVGNCFQRKFPKSGIQHRKNGCLTLLVCISLMVRD